MLSYTRERELILTIGQRMFAKDMVASNDGNISIRLPAIYLIYVVAAVVQALFLMFFHFLRIK